MIPQDAAGLAEAAAEAVREASRALRLVSRDEVLETLVARGFRDALEATADDDREAAPVAVAGESDGQQPTPSGDADARLAAILADHPGIASFASLSGRTAYHAPELLSRTYARILDRQGSPVTLVAEEIRTNSRDYPRPLPVALFEAPPFGLTPETITSVLRAMAASPEHRDITFTTASTGAVYLFSSLYLERNYATFLADRAETMDMNP